MTQDEIIELAKQSDLGFLLGDSWLMHHEIEYFAKLVAEKEREVVANWIMDRGFATGHGDSIVDLLDQLEWQIAEKEREACAKVCDDELKEWGIFDSDVGDVSKAIRARGQA